MFACTKIFIFIGLAARVMNFLCKIIRKCKSLCRTKLCLQCSNIAGFMAQQWNLDFNLSHVNTFCSRPLYIMWYSWQGCVSKHHLHCKTCIGSFTLQSRTAKSSYMVTLGWCLEVYPSESLKEDDCKTAQKVVSLANW